VKLVFDDRALADFEDIYNWIAKENSTVAKAVVERLFESIEHLATFPQMGHVGRWFRSRGADGGGLCLRALPTGFAEATGHRLKIGFEPVRRRKETKVQRLRAR
jgi:plasmid stabilization system protein ParE